MSVFLFCLGLVFFIGVVSSLFSLHKRQESLHSDFLKVDSRITAVSINAETTLRNLATRVNTLDDEINQLANSPKPDLTVREDLQKCMKLVSDAVTDLGADLDALEEKVKKLAKPKKPTKV